MPSNSELLKKADWAVSDLESTGGKLLPEQANAFIRKLLVQPTILRQARSVTMASPQRKINKIQFASRILKKATSATALAVGDRSKPTTEQIELNTKEVIAEVRLPYDVIEDNIERGNIGTMTGGSGDATGGIKDTIMTLIAERAALDLEELALLGDTNSGDTYLALVDGWLVQATSNVVDMAGAPITKSTFKNVLKAMPDQYLRNRAAMRNWVSVDNEIEYRDSLANRETALGDNQIQGTSPVFGYGVPVESASLMPEANALTTHPMNMIFGIQRDVHVETDKDITSRVYIIVLTARVDFLFEEELAVVKTTGLGTP
ncbi:MAG: hypothetical protein ACWGQW_01885 [bacterium]